MSKFYPEEISKHFDSPKHCGVAENANTKGKWASFLCGVSVRFSLHIDEVNKKITSAKFRTNGCGFVIASAEFICGQIIGEALTDLHGLDELERAFAEGLGEFSEDRKHCGEMCFEALQDALSEYRKTLVEEWAGEKALICTCFGVSEERLEKEIADGNLLTVEEVGEVCNAGTGCGSCQPLIQEVLDAGDGNF